MIDFTELDRLYADASDHENFDFNFDYLIVYRALYAAYPSIKSEYAKVVAERDALQGQVAVMRSTSVALRAFLSNRNGPHLNMDYEVWLPFLDALESTATIAAAHDARVRDEAIEECAKAAESEALVDNTRVPEDEAYNNAVKHCAAAIRALKTTGARSDDK